MLEEYLFHTSSLWKGYCVSAAFCLNSSTQVEARFSGFLSVAATAAHEFTACDQCAFDLRTYFIKLRIHGINEKKKLHPWKKKKKKLVFI